MNETYSQPDPTDPQSDQPLTGWLIAGAIAIFVLGGLAVFFFTRDDDSTDDLVTDSVPEATEEAEVPADASDTTPEEATASESSVPTTDEAQPDATTTLGSTTEPTTPNPSNENPPAQPDPLRQCYTANGDVLALDFSEDTETFTGALRIAQLGVTDLYAVSGRRTAGTLFDVNVQMVGSGTVDLQEWSAGASGMSAGSLTDVDAVECAEIAAEVADLDANVTSYPELPPVAAG